MAALVVMRSSTLRTCKRCALSGLLVGATVWLLKGLLTLLHLLRDTTLGNGPKTIMDYALNLAWWDVAEVFAMCLTICSGILLYVTVCPPPKDIDQHEA